MIAKEIPTISVIMSVYKEPLDWLRQSIESILNQTFADFEFIIICDNPDYVEGIELLKEYALKDNRVRLLFNEKNIGLTKSLNKGIDISCGSFIARMDADDISMPERFERQICFLKSHHDVDICGSNARLIGEKKGIVRFPQNNDQMFFFLDNCVIHSTVMMRKEVADLKYNESCWAAQDYELWYRAKIIRHAVFHNIQEVLVLYRCSKQQVTHSKRSLQDMVAFNVRRNALDDYLSAHNIPVRVSSNPICYNQIRVIYGFYHQIDLPRNVKNKLLFYLILSVDSTIIELLSFMFCSRIFFYLPLRMTASLVYHTVSRNKVRMF